MVRYAVSVEQVPCTLLSDTYPDKIPDNIAICEDLINDNIMRSSENVSVNRGGENLESQIKLSKKRRSITTKSMLSSPTSLKSYQTVIVWRIHCCPQKFPFVKIHS